MKHLLDVNVLLAAIWTSHPQNARAFAWLADKSVLLCPLSELGFLRISTHPGALGLSMSEARKALEEFAVQHRAKRIPADLDALDSHPRTSKQVTDCYLADLAVRHGAKLGTLDAGIVHPVAELIS